MRKLTTVVLAASFAAFATPVLAGSGCGGGHQKTAQTPVPTTTAEAPQTPKPANEGGT
ncbi:MAG: hypothetical protein QNJ94_02175 [Alphaproteobacteria bacterium]|nr:hypothetical protein [Alphaproteobacteria bacterium]